MAKKDDKEHIDPDYERWVIAISLYEREFEKWEKRVQKILKIYRRETNAIVRQTPAKFNVLWSNVQTLVPAVYSRVPKADVSRRFKDQDPVGRVASQLLERALDFELQSYPDFKTTLRQCVYDRFLGGRGTSWIRYEPHFDTQPAEPVQGLEVSSDTDEPEAVEMLKNEQAPTDYVHWRDFGCTIGRVWDEVTGVWRRVYMTRDAMVERFGEDIGNKIPLDSKPPDLRTNRPYGSDTMDARGLIYEIWDKESLEAVWISKSLGKILDRKPDPLELPDFFPCPKPLTSTMTSDSLVPIPDYVLYEDQARSLDTLADRIHGLIEALKVRGVYDAAVPELARLFSEGENNALIPVTNWAAFAEKQGLKGAIDLVDISMLSECLQQAYQAFEQVKNQIYEIIGLADIMRGLSQPEETLGAQQLKAHFGGNRLSDYQHQVAEYATEIIRHKAHVICTKFSDQTLLQMSEAQQLSPEDQAILPQAIAMLRCDPCRNFRIDIEADSMVEIDEETDRTARVEFLGALGGFLKQVAEAPPTLTPLIVSMLEFGVRGFKIGKTMEGEIDATMEKVKQNSQQPPQPSPEIMKIQAEGQQHQQQLQQDFQFKQQEIQLEVWKAQQIQQAQERDTQAQQQLEAQREAQKQQYEQQMELLRAANDRRMSEMEAHIKVLVAMIQRTTAIDVAEIGKETTLTAEQMGAAQAAQQGAQQVAAQ